METQVIAQVGPNCYSYRSNDRINRMYSMHLDKQMFVARIPKNGFSGDPYCRR